MKNITFDNFTYMINDNEFQKLIIKKYCNLKINKDIGEFERIVSLLNKFTCTSNYEYCNLYLYGTTHGGYIPLNCSKVYNEVILKNTSQEHIDNITTNIKNFNFKNIKFDINEDIIYNEDNFNVLFLNKENDYTDIIDKINFIDIVLLNKNYLDIIKDKFKNIFYLSDSDYIICLNNKENFNKIFKYYLDSDILNYDNLINLCIMVKNAGDQFEQTLLENLPFIDRWTILDTGSTDNTIDIIKKVLIGKKEGNLYCEPFINFKDSRNRLLDLAGKECKFNVMLDDTYVLKGNLKNFLNITRGDQYAKSFTLYIQDKNNKYGSNRVTKSFHELRYKFRIHEIIDDKNDLNICIPCDDAYIEDKEFDFMKKRSDNRKELDFKLLFEELEENPFEARTYYYLGQTYKLVGDYKNAFKYYLKRGEFINSGFRQELVDSLFEAGKIAQYNLNMPWEYCKSLYEKSYEQDKSRPDALYLIGSHYYLLNDYENAYYYLKKCFEIGYPEHTQFSLKPSFSFHFIPKLLTRICYYIKDYKTGEDSSKFFLLHNNQNEQDYEEIMSFYKIYTKLNIYKQEINIINKYNKQDKQNKQLFLFIADGGFKPWTGSTLLNEGLGGSETYIIEMASNIQKIGFFQTIVFCNTPNKKDEVCEEVLYKHLDNLYEFINTTHINTCIVSRYSEYLPLVYNSLAENVYFVLHDLTPSCNIIYKHPKLKNIFCLTEWHVSYFINMYPILKDITVSFYHGQSFYKKNIVNESSPKSSDSDTSDNSFCFEEEVVIKNKFIYSSFPNRGLLHLLEIWREIYNKYSDSTLHIYCNLEQDWVNAVEPEQINAIKTLLNLYSKMPNNLGIINHGWVDKQVLQKSWKTAEFWLYPCTFQETFCLTALESAISKTLAITNGLGALQNTVGNRGVLVEGNPQTNEWKKEALKKVFYYMDPKNKDEKDNLIQKNYDWACNLTWSNRAVTMLKEFVLKNKYEYLGYYDWTFGENVSDVENIIYYFNNQYQRKSKIINILEIGTKTGTSLINFISRINNCKGFGFDNWKGYEKDIFIKNILVSQFNKSINYSNTTIKNSLFELLKTNVKMDFIFITNINSINELYLYLNLSLEIIKENGIIAIYNCNNIKQDILNNILNIFIEKNNNLKTVSSNQKNNIFMKI